MLGAAQIGASQGIVNEFMKQAATGAAAGVAGRLIGAGVDAFLAARTARAVATAVDVANLSSKIVRQMASRDWTAQEIVETVQNGKAYSVVNKTTGGAATEYVNSATGNSWLWTTRQDKCCKFLRRASVPTTCCNDERH